MLTAARTRFAWTFALAFAFAVTFTASAAAQNPFTIDGNVPDAGAIQTLDPHGNVKELGPINGTATKIGVINSAPLPMLGFTNPNGQVDLNTVWSKTATATNGDIWMYFAWKRDANTGSGFLAIEMEHQQLSAGCVYTGVDQTDPTSSATLIANCNPWANRQAGDFLILWDQSGNSLTVYKRVFSGTAPNLTLGPATVMGTAVAQFSADGFSGELAIDLSVDVFTTGRCENFANTIPSTVTGNSDTADYKDTVLSLFPPISNCGSVDVTKYTQDPSGTRFSGTGTFPYTLARSGGEALRYAGDVNPGDSLTEVTGTLTKDGDKNTIVDLIAGTNYTLTEDTTKIGAQWTLVSIACTVGSGTTQYSSGSIPVVVNQVTHCIITNKYVLASPTATTVPSASVRLFDSASFSGIVNLGTLPTQATFKLYSDSTCTTQVTGSPVSGDLLYANNNTTATANTGTTGILVQPGTYYWTVTFPGNSFNNPYTTTCGSEKVTVSVSFQ